MTASLQRLTTEYVDTEDRIRISGAREQGGETLVLWLTQRLLNRLVPVLIAPLEREGNALPRADLLHGFAQTAARAALEPQAPVRTDAAQAGWLVRSVDVTPAEGAVHLTFRGGEDEAACLQLAPRALRQWLGIVHDHYRKGDWPLAAWPGWMKESASPIRSPAASLH